MGTLLNLCKQKLAALPADAGDNETDDSEDGFQIGPNMLKFGPLGKVRRAREATIIYAERDGEEEIGYLRVGAKVTVLACEHKGKGWCWVIRPRPSFVWGRDLK